MATSNSWRGMSSLSFSAILRPHSYALSLWMITLKASIGLAVDQHVEPHQVRLAVPGHLVVQRRVAAADRLQLVEEVEHDLAERELPVELHARWCRGTHPLVHPAPVGAQRHDAADVLRRRHDAGLHVRLLDREISACGGEVAGFSTSISLPSVL
jgi:hypothetical protein